MTKDEKTKVLQALKVMALALGQDPNEQRQLIYLDRLKALPIQAVLKAIERTMDEWKFNTYPPIGVIRDYAGVGDNKQALEDRAALTWDNLRSLRGKAYREAALDCPITAKCFRALGGIANFGMWNYEAEEKWRRKQFIELYATYSRDTRITQEFDQVESQGILQQITNNGLQRLS